MLENNKPLQPNNAEPVLIQFPRIADLRGNLTFLQNPAQIPFKIARAFWTYDVPGGGIRGAHAYREQEEIIIAMSGSFDIVLEKMDGCKMKFSLNRSYYGLYLPPLSWRHMENFSTNALSLHLSSFAYNPRDYIRDFAEYQQIVNAADNRI